MREARSRNLREWRAAAVIAIGAFVLAWLISFALGSNLALASAAITGFALALAIGVVVGAFQDEGPGKLREAVTTGIADLRSHVTRDPAVTMPRLLVGFSIGMVAVILLPRITSGAVSLMLAVLLLLPSEPVIARLSLAFWRRFRDGENQRTVAAATLFLAGAILASGACALVAGRAARVVLLAAPVVAFAVLRLARLLSKTGVVVLLLAGLMLADPPSADAAKKTLEVPGKQTTFVPVELEMPFGMQVTITAKGKVKFLRDNEQTSVGPDGRPAYYSGCDGPEFCGGLIGRMGDKGAAFAVGSAHTFVVEAAGPLYLAVNDFDPSDNTGSFDVTVEVVPRAASQPRTPAAIPTPPPSSTPSPGSAGHLAAGLSAAIGAVIGSGLGRGAARPLESAPPGTSNPAGPVDR